MSRKLLLAILFGCLLAQPFTTFAKAEEAEDDEEYDGEDEELPPDEEFDEKDVVVVTGDSFKDLIGKHKFALIEFYAPWCGHCKQLAPHYAKAATAMKEIDADVLIGKVDATEETSLAEQFEVSGYPTLTWFVDGKPSEYSGDRNEEGIVKWIKKKIGPPAAALSSADDLKKAEEEGELLCVGYFKEKKGAAYDAFIDTARVNDRISFAETTDAKIAEAAGLKAPGAVLIRNFKGEARETLVYDKAIEMEAFAEFLKSNQLPLTIEFNQDNSDRIFGAGIPRHILMLAKAKDLEKDAAPLKMLREVSQALKGKFVFVTVNADSGDAEPVVDFFGLDKEKSPTFVGFQVEPRQAKFMYDGENTAEAVKKFAMSIFDGTLKPQYKSEDIPEAGKDKDGDVQIVVGKTFDSIVKDPTKDVFLEIYAPWCGHCKKIAPTWKKLAKRFAGIDSVVIAKLDGTANEHADLEIEGFPSLLFFPAEKDNEGETYDGERSLKDMTKFIKEKAKIPYELKKKEVTEEAEEKKDEL